MTPTIPPALSTVADVPATLDEVVLRALAHDPEHRWPTVEAFVDALGRAASGAHVTPAPLPLAKTVPTSRGGALRTAGTLLLVLLVLAATFAGSYFLVGLLE